MKKETLTKRKRDSLIDKIKSPIITREIVKTIQAIDVKSIKAIADTITNILDVQLVDKDVEKVKVEIRKIVNLFNVSLK